MTSQVWGSSGISRGAMSFCREREHPWPVGLSNPARLPSLHTGHLLLDTLSPPALASFRMLHGCS